MLKTIGDIYYRLSGLEKLRASLGYGEKCAMLATFPHFHIVVFYSAFCDYNFYIMALTQCLNYSTESAYDGREAIKYAGDEGYVVFSGHTEIIEHRVALLDALRKTHNANSFYFEVKEDRI